MKELFLKSFQTITDYGGNGLLLLFFLGALCFVLLFEKNKNVHEYYGDYRLGDADLDGEVTILDATAIRRYDVNQLKLSDTATNLSDVDRDSSATVVDATWIQRWTLQMKAPEGIGDYFKRQNT